MIEAREVTVTYGAIVAVESADLAVRAGEVVGLVGPNGAGKSSLLRALVGELPLRAGTVTVDARPPREVGAGIAFLPQQPFADPDFPITVGEVALMGRYPHVGLLRRPGARDRQRAHEALTRVGLQDLASRPLGAVSGGQRQRAALARALAQEARWLLLDEPFAALDAAAVGQLTALLRALAGGGLGVLLVNHDLSVVRGLCDRVVLLSRRVIADGPPARVLTDRAVAAAYGA